MSDVVLDASAVVALLLAERGANKVRDVLTNAAISTINYAEIVGFFARRGGEERTIRDMLELLPINVIPVDARLARAAGMLLPATLQVTLPIGALFCLALARDLELPVFTADRTWTAAAAAIGVELTLVR